MMCFGPRAYSQNPATQAAVGTSDKQPLSLGLSISQNSNLKQRSDDEYDAYTDVLAIPTYSFSRVDVSAWLGMSKSWVDEQKFLIQDSRVEIVGKSVDLGAGFKFGYPVFLALPTSKASRKEKSLQASVGARPTINFDFAKIGFRNLKMFYGLSVSKNVHKYSTATDGSSNNEWGISNIVGAGLTLSKKLELAATFFQRNNFTYLGYLRQSFRHDERLSYALNDTISLGVGHTNEGSALKPNGEDTSSVFDRNNSEVYFSLNASF